MEKESPDVSIAMGESGLEGTYGKIKFSSVIDMLGRGMLVHYTKPNGKNESFSIDFKELISACFRAEEAQGAKANK